MKTVIDAVRYYGGHKFIRGKHEKHHTHIANAVGTDRFYSVYASDIGGDSTICTIDEFNQCVEEMTNMSIKPVSNIDWSEAPKSAEYSYKDNWWKVVNGKLFKYEKANLTGSYDTSYHWALSTYVEQLVEKMTPKPKPVYTQAMADNNELPSVGMLFATEAGEYTIDMINNKSACFTDEDGFLIAITIGNIKPIDTRTDEDKAIDYMNYAYDKDGSMTDVLSEIKKGYVNGVTWSGNHD